MAPSDGIGAAGRGHRGPPRSDGGLVCDQQGEGFVRRTTVKYHAIDVRLT
jgi:hypothetical protein